MDFVRSDYFCFVAWQSDNYRMPQSQSHKAIRYIACENGGVLDTKGRIRSEQVKRSFLQFMRLVSMLCCEPTHNGGVLLFARHIQEQNCGGSCVNLDVVRHSMTWFMSSKTIILVCADFFIFFLLLRIIIGNIKEIKRCFWYLIKPDILSIVDKTFDKDFGYTHRLLIVAIIMFLVVFAQIAIFY
jgi:hypothetical protein